MRLCDLSLSFFLDLRMHQYLYDLTLSAAQNRAIYRQSFAVSVTTATRKSRGCGLSENAKRWKQCCRNAFVCL